MLTSSMTLFLVAKECSYAHSHLWGNGRVYQLNKQVLDAEKRRAASIQADPASVLFHRRLNVEYTRKYKAIIWALLYGALLSDAARHIPTAHLTVGKRRSRSAGLLYICTKTGKLILFVIIWGILLQLPKRSTCYWSLSTPLRQTRA